MYETKLEQFQGPLDLLLQLIQGQKLNISEVSLALVTDQYLQYLDQVEDIDAIELADFLVVATKLLMIKSRALLPQLAEEESESAQQLEAQLKLYKDYLEASKTIDKLLKAEFFSYSRDRLPMQIEPTFSPPPSLVAFDLATMFDHILRRIEYVVNLPQRVLERVVSLKEKITDIRGRLQEFSTLSFSSLMEDGRSKTEVVVCFMALLELIKGGEVAVSQQNIFDDIVINRL